MNKRNSVRATARFELRSVRNPRRTSGEQFVQVRGADELDQVPLDPGRARELAAGMITVSRQGNQPQVLQLRMLREMPGDVVTAHVRKFEIHEQDRRQELDCESESSRAGVRGARITVPRRLQY